MTDDTTNWKRRLASPRAALAAGLVVSIGLMLMPVRWTGLVKGAVGTVLRPGQLGVRQLRDQGGWIAHLLKERFDAIVRLAESERQRRQLEEENRRLAAELATAESRSSTLPDGSAQGADGRLLVTQCVPARVLGQQARAFLARHHLLDVGSRAGIEPDLMVVDLPPRLIDRGSDARFRAGQLVLSEGRVWGKIVEVGPLTSTVQTVTEAGYRDLVRLGGPRAGGSGSSAGPQGMLEGTGEPLARIRLIEVTEPVAAGDPVYGAAGKGLLPEPLLYGRVVRVERPVGAAHWEIWMEPAVAPGVPERVAVLRAELNPLRVAERKEGLQNAN